MTHWNPITERTVGDLVILDMSVDWVSLSDTPSRLVGRIHELIEQGCVNVLVNLSAVRSVDSDGLGEIVRGFTDVREAGGRLALCGVTTHLRELLVTTKLDAYIPVFESEREGVRSFASPV